MSNTYTNIIQQNLTIVDQSCRINQIKDNSQISGVNEHKNYVNLAIIQDYLAHVAVWSCARSLGREATSATKDHVTMIH